MGGILRILLSADYFFASIRMASPLLLGATGGLFSERAGVLSLGMEGMMLSGSLGAFLGSLYTGSPWIGFLFGGLSGMAMGAIYALACVTFKADQVVAAVGFNILATGVTGLVFRGLFGISSVSHKAATFTPLNIPLLSKIPVIGPVLFQHLPPVYLAFLLVPVVIFIFYHTTWGLKLRSVGENPLAADTLGVNVVKMRYQAILIHGFLAGLGGALLSVGFVNTFIEQMTSGRGFVAFAAVIFGKWSPLGALGATLLFGAADAFQLRVQALGYNIPFQLLTMLPYAVTLLALVVAGKMKSPAALGTPYDKMGGATE